MQQCALKTRGAAAAVLLLLCAVAAFPAVGAAPSRDVAAVSETAEATVEELPQRPMTLRNGYHPGLFPFNKGEPFVVDPSTSAIDFNTRPPPAAQQRADDYYDYDTSKLEEVPYDYKGDPIDRKDVVEPNSAPRPNDIKPAAGVKTKPSDIYHFLNLPVKYSSSDKFPLMSSSYANTKIQGSGPSSSLSNHKMPDAAATATAAPVTSWYNAAKTTSGTTTTVRPTTTTTTTTAPTTTTSTTTTPPPPPPPSQEYEEESVYDYDYYHPQEPALVSDTAPVAASTTTSTTTTTTTTTSTTTERQNVPSTTVSSFRPTVVVSSSSSSPSSSSYPSTVHAAPSTNSSETTSDNYGLTYDDDDIERPPAATVSNNKTTTTARPEIDSKPDGPSFADYDAIKPSVGGGEHNKQQQQQQQQFKPMPGGYQFADDKTYPLITSGKVPMTFTAHVSSGISLNQKEPAQMQHQQYHHQYHHQAPDPAARPPPAPVSEPAYGPSDVPEAPPQGSNRPATDVMPPVYEGPVKTVTSPSASRPPPPPATYSKQKPPRPSEGDRFETVYYKVPSQPLSGAVATVAGRPAANQPPPQPPIQGRPPYQPERPESGARPQQPYPDAYPVKSKQPPTPQYAPAPSQPDTSKFKPPKHVINHFIKTQPNEDNKSYALQTSFSIGMDGGERAVTARPAQGVGQVLMVEDGGSAEPAVVNQTAQQQQQQAPAAVKPTAHRATTSIPFVPPPRLAQKPAQQYPRPQWENIPKPPTYYPPPKRDGPPPPPPPPQRTNLPNILPQFRPNAKVDGPPPPSSMMMMPQQSHSATIERVQIPMDHLRPPPLPKPQFLKVDRNDEDVVGGDAARADRPDGSPEKETRILQRAGPQQPAKVTTLQMIQHGASSVPTNNNNKRQDDGDTVHVVYAANAPPPPRPSVAAADRLHADDSVLLDAKDRSDVPVLKTKTALGRPVKTDFPYQIVRPDDGQGALEYKAYSPTKPDTARPDDQELVPNLQDYVPVVTRVGDQAANVAVPQRPIITATLRTSSEDGNHKTASAEDGGHKPQLQNFQIPFQPSMKLPENSNGWSVVRKSQVDSVSERADETGGDVVASTEKFDPDNFKPQLVGGFMPINPLTEEAKEKKTAEQPERA